MILAIRTDKPEAELYILNKQGKVLNSIIWHAHRELSNTLLQQIERLLEKTAIKQKDLSSLLVYSGPGSFTGLRIGISVANTLAYTLNIPIQSATGKNWLEISRNTNWGKKVNIVIPEYGQDPNITKPKK